MLRSVMGFALCAGWWATALAAGQPAAPPSAEPPSPRETEAAADEFDIDMNDIRPPPPPETATPAVEAETAPHVYTLERLEREVAARSPALEKVAAELDEATARKMFADWQYFPKITTRGVLAPAPKFRRPTTTSLDDFVNERQAVNSIETFGTSVDADLTMPLYTFGRIEHSRAAAGEGADVIRAKRRRVRAEILYQVRRGFYGLVVLRKMTNLLGEAERVLRRAVERVDRLLEEGSEQVTTIDRYRLQIAEKDVRVKINEAEQRRRELLATMRVFLGLEREAPVDVVDIEPAPLVRDARPADELRLMLTRSSPEAEMLGHGARAFEYLARAQSAEMWPLLFFRAQVSYTYTAETFRTPNPFLNNPFNLGIGGFFIGMRLELDVPQKIAQYRQARARAEAFDADRRLSLMGLEAQFETAETLIDRRRADLTANERARRAGRAWMISEALNFEAGVSSAQDLLFAVRGYLSTEGDYWVALFDYNESILAMQRLLGEGAAMTDAAVARP